MQKSIAVIAATILFSIVAAAQNANSGTSLKPKPGWAPAAEAQQRATQQANILGQQLQVGMTYHPYFSQEYTNSIANKIGQQPPAQNNGGGSGGGVIGGGTGNGHFHHHGPTCIFYPAHYEWVNVSVFVPAHWDVQYVPPVYDWRWVNGRQVTFVVGGDFYQRVIVPGHYEIVPQYTIVSACWSCGF